MRPSNVRKHPILNGRSRGRHNANARSLMSLGMSFFFVVSGIVASPMSVAQKRLNPPPAPGGKQTTTTTGKTMSPVSRPIVSFPPVNVTRAAKQEALEPLALTAPAEIRSIDEPREDRPTHGAVPILLPSRTVTSAQKSALGPSATGTSPIPSKSFKAEFLSGTTIPPDTMGAVGTTHVVTVSNDRMRIQTRDGVEIARMTLTSFWAGVTIKGVAATAFDPKVYFDRFNNRFILISSGNGQGVNSGALFAVSQTSDPTGTWNRYSVVADPASTATTGHWIDYPTVGFNKNWIVVDENVFNFGTAGTGFYGTQIYVLDKQAAYSNTLGSISLFEDTFANCVASPTPETSLGCGFTMAPSINEENTTDTDYLVEDWDNVAGQLRLSKITGTPAAPVITIGTQFPQSGLSWQYNAARIGTTGGYAPQRQQSANLASSSRVMTNDSRIQNAVFRAGSLWCAHTVMLSSTPTPAGTGFNSINPDNHSAVQWWQIDPTVETGASNAPIQRGRIEDPTANNCHNGSGGNLATAPCNGTTSAQFGIFYAFPNISVNMNNDVLIGFTQFSPLTYANSAYAFRASTDTPNLVRDPVIFRPGQANYNIGAGSGAARQNRWGDFSSAQTDPLDDTSFWTIQEYAGTVRDFGIGLAGNWETWWTLVKPSNAAPSRSGSLIISEFRLRGPQGARDEYVELYNPGNSPLIVNTTDNSEGWALASNNGTTTTTLAVIPNGTVIPARGHFLIADNPDGANGPTVVYSLNSVASSEARTADSDTGWSLDVTDTSGLALFNTSNTANFSALTVLDAAGPNTLPGGSLFKEGAGFAPLPTTNLQYAMFRNQAIGFPQDTGNNAADFIFADTASTATTAGQHLGTPGPENLSSPITSFGLITGLIDPMALATASPNRVRDATPGPVATSTFGTLSIRRKFTNATGSSVSKLSFRIIDVTSSPAPVGTADLRAISSVFANVTVTGGGTVPVQGLTVEEPPTQAMGGGLNTSLATGTITLATPLAAGDSINVNFLLGVQQGGNFRFFILVNALQ